MRAGSAASPDPHRTPHGSPPRGLRSPHSRCDVRRPRCRRSAGGTGTREPGRRAPAPRVSAILSRAAAPRGPAVPGSRRPVGVQCCVETSFKQTILSHTLTKQPREGAAWSGPAGCCATGRAQRASRARHDDRCSTARPHKRRTLLMRVRPPLARLRWQCRTRSPAPAPPRSPTWSRRSHPSPCPSTGRTP